MICWKFLPYRFKWGVTNNEFLVLIATSKATWKLKSIYWIMEMKLSISSLGFYLILSLRTIFMSQEWQSVLARLKTSNNFNNKASGKGKKEFSCRNNDNHVRNIKLLYCSIVQNVNEVFKYPRVSNQACVSNVSQGSIVFKKQCFQCGFTPAKRAQAQPHSQNSCTTSNFFGNSIWFLRV